MMMQWPSVSITGGSLIIFPASPPQFVSLDQMMSASNIVNNMMLAHEIALDEDFRIEKPEPAEGR